MTTESDDTAVRRILDFQDGVITRRQLLDAGWSAGQVRGRLRRGDWVAVYPGTYLTHTGEITWRQRAWAAVLDAGASAAVPAATEPAAIATLTDAVGARLTTASRLLAAASRRSRLRQRRLIEQVLVVIRDGTCSVLEHGYLTRVERAHGLPTPRRQAPTEAGRPGFRLARPRHRLPGVSSPGVEIVNIGTKIYTRSAL